MTGTGTTTITVKLTPGARKNEIKGWEEDLLGERILKVSVTTIPEKGKANKALIDLLAKAWKIPKSAITIIRGETSRVKVLEISKPALIISRSAASPIPLLRWILG